MCMHFINVKEIWNRWRKSPFGDKRLKKKILVFLYSREAVYILIKCSKLSHRPTSVNYSFECKTHWVVRSMWGEGVWPVPLYFRSHHKATLHPGSKQSCRPRHCQPVAALNQFYIKPICFIHRKENCVLLIIMSTFY